jgi:uncharacterized coiled-coil DUF342 family protein
LELHGQKPADHSQGVPSEVADLVFGVQEELADLRDARNAGLSQTSDREKSVNQKRSEIIQLIDALAIELQGAFAEIDDETAPKPVAISRLKEHLAKLAYLKTLLRDVEKALDRRAAA